MHVGKGWLSQQQHILEGMLSLCFLGVIPTETPVWVVICLVVFMACCHGAWG